MKGLVGGIPIALLAAAAHAMEHGTQNDQDMQTRSHHPHVGGTAMGGPSGNDEDGGFNYGGAIVQTHTTVDEYSKDDHSIKIKETDVYPPPLVFGPGEGPFPKRGLYPHYGGTAMGGPSGNDGGQTFDMPIIANVQTAVDEYAKDDHSIQVKNKDIHPPPVFAPVMPPHHFPAPHHPPAGFGGRPSGFRDTANPNGDDYHVPASAFEKRWGYEAGGTAMGGPSGGDDDNGPDNGGEEPHGFSGPFVSGGTAEGGPSGDDDGVSFGNPMIANVHNNVNEYSKDDHSVDVKNTEIYPPPFPPFGAPFKRDWEPVQGGTAMGGPSGNDGGQTFSAPIIVDVTTGVHEHYEDDHSIDLQYEDVYPRPPFPIGHGAGPMMPHGGASFRRAYAPERVPGGTAMGGPSGEDGGVSFGNPTAVGVDSNVNEHSEDNHAIKVDTTHVHPPPMAVPHMPWMPYHDETPIEHPGPVAVPHVETPEAAPAPPSAPAPETHEEQPVPPFAPEADHGEVPQCASQEEEVVHTVTKTQYNEVHPTLTVYATPVAVPMSATPQESQADPKVVYSAPAEHGSEFVSVPAAPTSSAAASSHDHMPQRPMSSSASYSMIPVQIPSVTRFSSMMMPMATPSSSHGLPSGADALHRPSASSKPSAVMFQGSAARISGGIVSVAAAVVGVLAFVL